MHPNISDSWFDSSLHLNEQNHNWNAILQIRIRTHLNPYRPVGGEESLDGIRVIGWDSTPQPVAPRLSWHDYKVKFKHEVESFWSNRLWLVPEIQWRDLSRGTTPRLVAIPNISCRLTIEWASRDNAHMCADVVRLHPTETFRRSSCRMPDWRGRIQDYFLSNDLNLDDLDVLERNGTGTQIPLAHEMGHYLGLDHVAGAGDDPENYGAGYQVGDIMGGGVRLEAWHAFPWKKRLRRHMPSRIQRWNATRDRPLPRRDPPEPPQRRRSSHDVVSGGVLGRDAGI